MDRRLIPINAWIALMRGDAGWPRPLGEQGLIPAWFEVPISTTESTVTVDGVAFSSDLAIVAEAKSGANVDVEQARKYGAMSLQNLRRIVSPNPPLKPDAKLEVMYVCLEENESRVAKGLETAGIDCATLVIGEQRCRLRASSNSLLSPFEVIVPGPPPAYIPIDAESPDAEIEDVFVAEIVGAMNRGDSVVAVSTLIERVPFLANLGVTAKSQLAARVTKVLQGAAVSKFKGDFSVSLTTGQANNLRGGNVTILKNPADSDPRGQTQGWQRLQRRASGRPRRTRREIDGQLSLDEFASETEKGDTER